MALKSFTFDPDLTDLFVRFEYELYRDDPAWIPPLERDVRSRLAPTFVFHAQPGNTHRRFLALANGRPVARALAAVNRDLADADGTPVGAVGFFESADDPAAAGDVLSAAFEWLRDAHGLRRAWGPLNFDIWHGYRLMTLGFDRPRFLGEPYNKPYYPALFEAAGFVPRRRWTSLEVGGPEPLARLMDGGEVGYRSLLERGYRFEPFDPRSFDVSVARLHAILTRSFSRFLGYTPIELAEFRRLMRVARHAIQPDASIFVYDEMGRPAAFTGAFLDLAEAVRAMRGSSGPLAQLRFLHKRRRTRRVMLHLGGLTPEEAARRTGLARATFHHVVGALRRLGYESVLATLIADGNPVRRLWREHARDRRREYTLYERAA